MNVRVIMHTYQSYTMHFMKTPHVTLDKYTHTYTVKEQQGSLIIKSEN